MMVQVILFFIFIEPTGNSITISNLFRLYHYLEDKSYNEKAISIITSFSNVIQKIPHALSELMCSFFNLIETPPIKFIIFFNDNHINEIEKNIKFKLFEKFIPFKSIIFWNMDDDKCSNFWKEKFEYFKDIKLKNDKITYMLCKNFTCQLPTNDLNDILNNFNK
jgi:uncharacterized protein YyaL (SSP411 family)